MNGRWPSIDKKFMKEVDMVFISETHAVWNTLPEIPDFKCFGDPSAPLTSSHGGLVVYVKDVLYEHLYDIRFSKCTISFKLDFIPDFAFMRVY